MAPHRRRWSPLGAAAALLWALCAATAAAAVYNTPVMHINKVYAAGWAPYIDLLVGTPSQRVAVVLDTGSATLGVPSAGTAGPALPQCASQAQYAAGTCVVGGYAPAASTSAVFQSSTVNCSTPVTLAGGAYCGFAVTYGAGVAGMAGALVTDTVTVAGLAATVTVGAIAVVQEGFQEPPAGGILGVAGDTLNCNPATLAAAAAGSGQVTCRPAALGQLLAQNGLPDAFGLCVGTPSQPGVLSLGGGDGSFYSGSLRYTPLVAGGRVGAFYTVVLRALAVNHVSTGLAPALFGATVVDSGSFQLVLAAEAYDAFAALSPAPCATDAQCAVQLLLNGSVTLNVPGLLTCVAGACAVAGSGSTGAIARGSPGQTILGYKVLQQVYTVFDRANRRIGFAPVLPCVNPCPAFLSSEACLVVGGCLWNAALRACSPAPAPPSPASPSPSPASHGRRLDRGAEGAVIAIGVAVLLALVVGAFVAYHKITTRRRQVAYLASAYDSFQDY